MKKVLIICSLVFTLASLGVPLLAHAQTPILPSSVRTECLTNGNCTTEDVFELINGVIAWGAAVCGAFALLMYIIGGVWMLFSAGNQQRIERGKNIIIGTSTALLFILGSWIIVDFTLDALTGRTEQDLIEPTKCNQPENEGKPCGTGSSKGSFCYQGVCITKCEEKAKKDPANPWACQNYLACVPTLDACSGDNCIKGYCPNDPDEIVCCYKPSST